VIGGRSKNKGIIALKIVFFFYGIDLHHICFMTGKTNAFGDKFADSACLAGSRRAHNQYLCHFGFSLHISESYYLKVASSGIRSHLKKVFSPDIGVEPSYQVLDILEYACGLILGLVFRLRLKATADQ
jgi:hypothetical protein